MNIKTEYLQIDSDEPKKDILKIERAAELLKHGGLVAFPTETVYGLGADAFNSKAIRRIYEAKGRPSDNPLILHIATREQLVKIAENIPETAQRLIEAFWPGPLTLVLEKAKDIPQAATAGLDTIAVRLPYNKTARLLLKTAGIPIAAPSANSSGKPSPTRASHVLYDLDGKIDMILDGGASEYGLESTIVDVTGKIPCILRPGSITVSMLQEIVGYVEIDSAILKNPQDNIRPKAPGMKYTHYSPIANVVIVTGKTNDIVEKIKELSAAESENRKIGILATEQTKDLYKGSCAEILSLGDRERPETIAGNLFNMLRRVDYLGIELVFAEGIEESDIGLAIMNRLKKAAGYMILNTEVL